MESQNSLLAIEGDLTLDVLRWLVVLQLTVTPDIDTDRGSTGLYRRQFYHRV